jgi:hypothetical protein
MTRQKANEELVKVLNELIQNNPDLRFSQILYSYRFVKPNRPTIDAGDNWQNEFYVEPVELLKRVNQALEDYKND